MSLCCYRSRLICLRPTCAGARRKRHCVLVREPTDGGNAHVPRCCAPRLTALDVRALNERQLEQAESLFAEFAERDFLPANEDYRDETRHALDRAVLCGLLGLPSRSSIRWWRCDCRHGRGPVLSEIIRAQRRQPVRLPQSNGGVGDEGSRDDRASARAVAGVDLEPLRLGGQRHRPAPAHRVAEGGPGPLRRKVEVLNAATQALVDAGTYLVSQDGIGVADAAEPLTADQWASVVGAADPGAVIADLPSDEVPAGSVAVVAGGQFLFWMLGGGTTASDWFDAVTIAWLFDTDLVAWTSYIPALGQMDFALVDGAVLWVVSPIAQN